MTVLGAKKLILLIIFCLGCILLRAQQSAEDYVNSGNIKGSQKNYSGAISDYSNAIELEPKYGLAYFYRGAAKEQLGDHKGAITDFDKSIEINPKYGLAYFYRGISKFGIEDKEGSCADWNKAGKLGCSTANQYIKDYCN